MRALALLLVMAPGVLWAQAFTIASGGVRAHVASWGPDCGPRPSGARAKVGERYLLAGDRLAAQGGARPLFQRDICHLATGLPDAVEVRAGDRFTCRTPPEAAKRLDGDVVLTRAAAGLEVRHRFSYRWGLQGSRCLVTLSGQWSLVPEAGALASAPAVASAASDAPATAAPVSRRRPRRAQDHRLLAADAPSAEGGAAGPAQTGERLGVDGGPTAPGEDPWPLRIVFLAGALLAVALGGWIVARGRRRRVELPEDVQ